MAGCEIKRFSRVLVTGGAGFLCSHLVDSLMVKDFHAKVFKYSCL